MIHARLTAIYEDLLFPADAIVLGQNAADFQSRVSQCNETANSLASFLVECPSIDSVYYPNLVSTSDLYERYRRQHGGYGYLLSILFKEPESAVLFYNILDICKGPSIGANFSLALPYAQLVHYFELDWAESQGVGKHIVRLSVGLESHAELLDRITAALREVARYEEAHIEAIDL
jgi:cystathionine gamma-synthase